MAALVHASSSIALPARPLGKRASFAGARVPIAARPVASRAAGLRVRADASEEASVFVEKTAEKIKMAWEKTDDKVAVVGLGVFGFVGLWALNGVVKAVDSLPLLPNFLELIGIAFTAWFVYRYLLFKPDREELGRAIDEFKRKILQ